MKQERKNPTPLGVGEVNEVWTELCVQLTLLKWIRQRFLCYPPLKKRMQLIRHTGTLSLSSTRLEALELMRQINYGYDPITDRLQRVLEVDELTRS